MKRLNEHQIYILRQLQDNVPRRFLGTSALYYEDQVPVACYLLLEGKIILRKKKKIIIEVPPGHIIGFNDFQNGTPSDVSAWILAGSMAFIIDKSTFIELKDHENEEVQKIVS